MKDIRTKGFERLTRYEDALNKILRHVHEFEKEEIFIEDSLNRICGEDVVSEIDVPHFDRAAMDGYAVIAENTFGSSITNPLIFEVIGEMEIGKYEEYSLKDYQAVKIYTGCIMPKNANAVVKFEHVIPLDNKRIQVIKPVSPGKNVSFKGEDIKRGDVVIKKGEIINPYHIAALAGIGKRRILVYKKPRVAIFSVGNELIEAGQEYKFGKVYDINSFALYSLAIKYNCIPYRKILPDNYEIVKKEILNAVEKFDIIITTGATSVGKEDFMPLIVNEIGKLLVHGVSIRPGEPTGIGIINNKPIFLLPGFPVASVIGFLYFVRPVLEKMFETRFPRIKIKGRLARKVASTLGRRDFVRVKVLRKNGEIFIEPIRLTGSGIISSMLKADGLLIVDENIEGFEEGEEVEVELIKI